MQLSRTTVDVQGSAQGSQEGATVSAKKHLVWEVLLYYVLLLLVNKDAVFSQWLIRI